MVIRRMLMSSLLVAVCAFASSESKDLSFRVDKAERVG